MPGFSAREPKYEYFQDEPSAKKFIVLRAELELAKAEREVLKAKLRLNKCRKKFGTPNAAKEGEGK